MTKRDLRELNAMKSMKLLLAVLIAICGMVMLASGGGGGGGDNSVEKSTILISRFVIQGRTVIARPGVTAIREGNTHKTVNDVTVGK